MPNRRPYNKISDSERQEIISDLIIEWTKDWREDFGKDKDGAMIWHCNASDVMLLVDEIQIYRAGRYVRKGEE